MKRFIGISVETHPRWVLVALHAPFVAFLAGRATFGLGFEPSNTEWLGIPLVLIAGAIQLRHSLAAAEGERPRYWPLTFALLVLIAYAPLPIFGDRWPPIQWFVIASSAMLLSRRAGIVIAALSAVGFAAWATANDSNHPPITLAWSFCYMATILLIGGVSLWGAAQLVRLLGELRAARAELAELAIGRERLRISRDLHDLLGQSLSAVSLKGDLAIGLVARHEHERAAAEIESLVDVARSALHDLRDVTHGELPISLRWEIDRATDLLGAIGIDVRTDVEIEELTPAVDELFAWAVREGVTNVLRHSTASICSISTRRREGILRLEIVNDGASSPPTTGHGLSGLSARAAALDGTVRGRASGDGRFRLVVELPEMAEVSR
jgi:two-component system, NarL family, sensor histidine kinase DesK